MQPAGRGDDHGPVTEATYGVPEQRHLQPTSDVVEVRGPPAGRLPQREPGERDRLLRLRRRAHDQMGDPAGPGDQRVQHPVDVDELDERRAVQASRPARSASNRVVAADVPAQVVGAPPDRALRAAPGRRPACAAVGEPSARASARRRRVSRRAARRLRELGVVRWVDGRLGQCGRAPPLAPLQQHARVRCATAWRRARAASSSPCRVASARSSELPEACARCSSSASSPRRQAASTPRRSSRRRRAPGPAPATRSLGPEPECRLRYRAARPSSSGADSGAGGQAPAARPAARPPRRRPSRRASSRARDVGGRVATRRRPRRPDGAAPAARRARRPSVPPSRCWRRNSDPRPGRARRRGGRLVVRRARHDARASSSSACSTAEQRPCPTRRRHELDRLVRPGRRRAGPRTGR